MKTILKNTINSILAFKRLIQPLSEESAKLLELEILSDPDQQTIVIWKNTHLVDEDRMNICLKYNIPYIVKQIAFDNERCAAIFICTNQLTRKDLTEEYRKYLIGQKFHYSLLLSKEERASESKFATALNIARELSCSAGTVLKYNVYSSAINTVYNSSNELATDILMGKIRISHENIIELSRLMPEEIRAIHKAALRDNIDHLTVSYIRHEVKWSHMRTKASISRSEYKERNLQKIPEIQQMPRYDPDKDVNSLCMTMDSWISSIERISKSETLCQITSKASLRLIRKLSVLEHSAKVMQEKLEERTEK